MQLRQQPTHSRLKFINDYLQGAQRVEDKEYTFTSLGISESSYNRDKSTLSVLEENTSTGVASPSRTDLSSPSCHLPPLVISTLNPLSQSSDLDSPTTSLSSASSLCSEAMVEDSCPPKYLPQKMLTCRVDAEVPGMGDVIPVSVVDS